MNRYYAARQLVSLNRTAGKASVALKEVDFLPEEIACVLNEKPTTCTGCAILQIFP
jgi:hypothetical protein